MTVRFFYGEKGLTVISCADIIYISYNDITGEDIIKEDRFEGRRPMQNVVLTEAIYYTLLSLTMPMHGYGIMQNVKELSKGRVRLAAGTLYGVINNLLDKNWIEALPEEEQSRKKEYRITDLGKEILVAEIERLHELWKNGENFWRAYNENHSI